MIEHFGIARDAGEIFREGGFRGRDGDLFEHLAALRHDRFAEEIAVIVAEGEIREDHGDFLAKVFCHEGRHRLHLAFHIGNAGLKRVAV